MGWEGEGSEGDGGANEKEKEEGLLDFNEDVARVRAWCKRHIDQLKHVVEHQRLLGPRLHDPLLERLWELCVRCHLDRTESGRYKVTGVKSRACVYARDVASRWLLMLEEAQLGRHLYR